MRIHLIAPRLPPSIDGIGDYTALLARELTSRAIITILTGTDQMIDHIPQVEIRQVFSPDVPRSILNIRDEIQNARPDWVIVQFNQFSYGRWGWNPYLPLVFRSVGSLSPETRVAVMFHEDFVPLINLKFAIMTTWQRLQFRALGRAADLILFSIDPWTQIYRSWFPGKSILHLPVGSNIPRVKISRNEARSRLGIDEDCKVLGLFGTAHASRLLEMVKSGVNAARTQGHNVLLLYVGPHGTTIRDAFGSCPIIADGPLPASEVSKRFAAMDLYFAPFVDGVSTRRTSFITGLQHGVPTVGTRGPLTDELLRNHEGQAFLLAGINVMEEFDANTLTLLADSALRSGLGQEGEKLFEREFAWGQIADKLLNRLEPKQGTT
jgi:glycosyltransferase involved in cell wall biosynthesis